MLVAALTRTSSKSRPGLRIIAGSEGSLIFSSSFFFFLSYMYYACMNVYVCICIYTLYSLQSKIRNKYVKFFFSFFFPLLAVVVRGDGVYIINRYIRSRVYWLQRRHIL